VIHSAVLIIPLTGLIYLLIKILVCQVKSWRVLHEKESRKINIIGKMGLTTILIVYGVSLEVFLICVLWIPNFHIPRLLGLAGIIFIVPYLAGIFVLFYGIGPTIGITSVSTTRIFRELFPMKSKSDSGRKEKTKEAEEELGLKP
jgi:hypothetical protein